MSKCPVLTYRGKAFEHIKIQFQIRQRQLTQVLTENANEFLVIASMKKKFLSIETSKHDFFIDFRLRHETAKNERSIASKEVN